MMQIFITIFSLITCTHIPFSTTSPIPTANDDCSKYSDDQAILHAFPFTIEQNPSTPTARMTYARMKNKQVYQLKIVSEKQCIPSLIFCFKSLSTLQIDNANFCSSKGELPADIARLGQSLTHLSISNTEISHVPNEIGQLKYLERLEFSNTGVPTLPETIGNLSSLEFLFLHRNKLSSLPTTLHQIRSLHQVVVTQNPNLRSIQSLNGHPTLRLLIARQCSIELLPQNLSQLHFLNMADNRLKHLHGIDTLGEQSSEMKNFNFHGNQIDVLTSSIASIANLFQLNLARNRLRVLPEDIFQIMTLKELNIADNPFHPRVLKQIIAHFHRTNSQLILFHDQSQ